MKIKMLTTLLFVLFISFLAYSADHGKTLESTLAGTWYPANSGVLSSQLDSYLNNVKEGKLENIIALILPHAGYQYSGQTAAYGVKKLQGRKYSRVIIIGPSHHSYMRNKICVPDVDAFRTPLGKVPVDTNFINKLKKNEHVIINTPAHALEHSVQIELPLLQKALGNFKFVPIIAGQLDKATIKSVAAFLRSIMDSNTLVVISSDFTHYGPSFRYLPFPNNFQIEDNLKKLDMGAVKEVETKNFDGFYDYVQKKDITICGRCPILILLAMLPENAKGVLLHYDTSGKQMNDFTNSVSYVSMAFSGKWDLRKKEQKNKTATPALTRSDKKKLLELARKTLVYYMKNGVMPDPKELGITISPNMKQKMGAFVTLHKNGCLRGCIGEILPQRPLYQAVMNQAVNSALKDYRFPKVTLNEVPSLEFEISALTPPKDVSSYKDIILGKDGIIISKNGCSAVFLPQVAPEQGWNMEQTLSHLSQKAGLESSAWKSGARFTVFQAIVFRKTH